MNKTQLQTNNSKFSNLITALQGKAVGGDTSVELQEKTVTPATSSQTITPDTGYDGLSKVTVNAMPTATQATPAITVSSAGLITASSTQTAGYVAAGTKSATKQLSTQAAQTITPGTSNKTIASGKYLTGTQTIKGDANLIPANIAEGVSIFGVTGTHSASGGDNTNSNVVLEYGTFSAETPTPYQTIYEIYFYGIPFSPETKSLIIIATTDPASGSMIILRRTSPGELGFEGFEVDYMHGIQYLTTDELGIYITVSEDQIPYWWHTALVIYGI